MEETKGDQKRSNGKRTPLAKIIEIETGVILIYEMGTKSPQLTPAVSAIEK